MSIEMKKCRWCGGKGKVCSNWADNGYRYWVVCENCDCDCCTPYRQSLLQAMVAWNKSHGEQPDDHEAHVEAIITWTPTTEQRAIENTEAISDLRATLVELKDRIDSLDKRQNAHVCWMSYHRRDIDRLLKHHHMEQSK